MRTSRAVLLAILLAIVIAVSWFALSQRSRIGNRITVYYTKIDGVTEIPWVVSMRPKAPGETNTEHVRNAVLYAATQAIAGPASDVQAVRFPIGTHVRSVNVTGSTAMVDLSKEVERGTGGTFGENGEFKSLVWTLTALPGIDAVAVEVDGATLQTLPGGHVELDQPLRRSDW